MLTSVGYAHPALNPKGCLSRIRQPPLGQLLQQFKTCFVSMSSPSGASHDSSARPSFVYPLQYLDITESTQRIL